MPKMLLTYELCRFIWPFVDECFKSLLHGINKLLVLHEADVNDVIHLVFEVEQLLHHGFVFLRIDYDCTSKSLVVDFQDIAKQWEKITNRKWRTIPESSAPLSYITFCLFISVFAVIPLCILSSAAGGPERHLALDWRADREETDPESCFHPEDESDLKVSTKKKFRDH